MRYKSSFRFCQFLLTIYQKDFIKRITPFTSILKTTRLPDMPASRKNDRDDKVVRFDIDGDGSKTPYYWI